jgi:predicted amidohydrolase YtcJ
LAPGKFADVTVLSGDPYHVDPAEIRHLNVTMTIVNGIVRYAR